MMRRGVARLGAARDEAADEQKIKVSKVPPPVMPLLLAVLALMLVAPSGASASSEAHRVVTRAINHDKTICPRIEWSVFLKGYHKAQMAFFRDWKDEGFQDDVDGRDVFAQLVRQCGERKRAE